MDLEALKKERETLNNDKRKGRAYLDLQLGNAIREIEAMRVESERLRDNAKLAWLVTVAILIISSVMTIAVWMMR